MSNEIIRPRGQRVVMVDRRRANEWSDEQRAEFFGTLAQTCHVARAAEAAGINVNHAYYKRRSDPVFAEEWRVALTLGYERLEEELLRIAIAGLAGAGERVAAAADAVEAARPGVGMPRKVDGSADVQLALALLNRHRANVEAPAALAASSRQIARAVKSALGRID